MLCDRLRRRRIADNELTRMALRYLARTPTLPARTRFLAQFRLGEMPSNTALTRLGRRCTITGRGRSIIGEFNISRMVFRQMALNGQLLAVQKSSW